MAKSETLVRRDDVQVRAWVASAAVARQGFEPIQICLVLDSLGFWISYHLTLTFLNFLVPGLSLSGCHSRRNSCWCLRKAR